jgi:hypothetical protein
MLGILDDVTVGIGIPLVAGSLAGCASVPDSMKSTRSDLGEHTAAVRVDATTIPTTPKRRTCSIRMLTQRSKS